MFNLHLYICTAAMLIFVTGTLQIYDDDDDDSNRSEVKQKHIASLHCEVLSFKLLLSVTWHMETAILHVITGTQVANVTGCQQQNRHSPHLMFS